MQSTTSITQLHIPIIDYTNIKINLEQIDCNLIHGSILVNNQSTTKNLKEMWIKFEENLYINAFKTSLPLLFKPQITILDKNTDNKQISQLVVNENLTLSFSMKNSLKINLKLNDIQLIWKFVDQNDKKEIINDNNFAESSIIDNLIIKSKETVNLSLKLKANKSNGYLTILGILYKLSLETINNQESISLNGKHLFEIKGQRLNNTSQAQNSNRGLAGSAFNLSLRCH